MAGTESQPACVTRLRVGTVNQRALPCGCGLVSIARAGRAPEHWASVSSGTTHPYWLTSVLICVLARPLQVLRKLDVCKSMPACVHTPVEGWLLSRVLRTETGKHCCAPSSSLLQCLSFQLPRLNCAQMWAALLQS